MNRVICKISKILFGMLSLIVLNGCSNSDETPIEKPLRPVRTMIVTAPDLSRAREFTAVVDASRKADLSFRVSGEIIEFYVKQGDEVLKGQTLAKLDDKDIKLKLQEAQSSYDKSKADFERGKSLIKSNTISQAEYDKLRAQHNSAKAKLDIEKNNLDYTQLKASFDGVIARRHTENFQEINAKEPILALHDLSNIDLKIDVPESVMIRIQKKEIPTKLSATFESIDDVEFPLTFKEVSTQADEVKKTYEVTLTMKNPQDRTILPGMTALVRGERIESINLQEDIFFLPVKTVLKDSKGNYVFTVEEKSDGVGVIQRRSVTVGEITQLGIEIHVGINQGDRVLTAGMSKVSNGMEVKY